MRVWLTDARTAIELREWKYALPGWLFRLVVRCTDSRMRPMLWWTAPWDRRFRTFYCRGWLYHELQFGPWVFQVARAHKWQRGYDNVVVWRDPFWR